MHDCEALHPEALIHSHWSKLFPLGDLTDEEAVLLEPTSCAIRGMDKLQMSFGSKVLLIGAGPTGLVLAQLMSVSDRGEPC